VISYDLERERILSENTLTDSAYDFSAKYMAVYSLQTLAESNPEVINSDTISVLEKVLTGSEFTHQTQAYFMYKEVANTLCSIIIHSEDLADNALDALKNLLGTTSGHPHRATAEALGSLPFSIHGPKITSKMNGLPGLLGEVWSPWKSKKTNCWWSSWHAPMSLLTPFLRSLSGCNIFWDKPPVFL